ncbi:nitroreductase family protein [Clostridium sp. DL1XJH146]
MMKVNSEKCIGCGQCVKECIASDIQITDGKATMNNVTCFKCGHCIAVCPVNAISTDAYNMDDVVEYNEEKFHIGSDTLLNFIKFRRSIRQFKNKEVEKEKLSKIIEAGRFTQTGSNMQDVSFIVIEEKMEEVKDLTYTTLKNVGEHMLANLTPETMMYKRYAEMWVNMYHEHKENPEENDRLFFNAPTLVIVTANSPVNGALASSNMELMANAVDLGTFFSGFFIRAAQSNKALKDLIGVQEGKDVVTCMVLGYPDVKFKRTAPRKDADIIWN